MSKTLWDIANGEVVQWRGSFTLNGTATVTVTPVPITLLSTFEFGLAKVGGTVGALPAVTSITPSVAGNPGPQGTPGINGSFTVVGSSGDTSTYNYRLLN